MADKPWKDRKTVYELYVDEDLTQSEVADELDCGLSTISEWIDRHDIDTPHTQTENLRDEEWLYDKYWDEMMSTTEIAESLDCSQAIVSRWLRKHDIKTRKSNDEKLPAFGIDKHGYERWRTYVVDESHYRVRVHRLLMVAEEGIDAVKDKEVHHKNEIKWDNRPENLELMTTEEHRKHHCPF